MRACLLLLVSFLFTLAACNLAPDNPPASPSSEKTSPPTLTPVATAAMMTATAVPETPSSEPTTAPPTAASSPMPSPTASLDSFPAWQTVTLAFAGPEMDGLDAATNPFAVPVTAAFTAPDGSTRRVPAFFAGDGAGAQRGNVWQVRFTPDVSGVWQYEVTGPEQLDGQNGRFQVTEAAECPAYTPGGLPDFSCAGRLIHDGRYLRFAQGPYWLKGGADEPEDFLAPNQTAGFESDLAAINYLAERGVNSIYLLLHNVEGDGRNVWPWAGNTEAEAKANHTLFDVARLEEWEALFSYIQSQGIVLHLILEDDSAWTGFDRQLYYREMVARFAHHNGLIWNLAEEYNENYRPEEIIEFATMLRDLDPYDHPITVHHAGPLIRWEPFLDNDLFDITSFQTEFEPVNELAVNWWRRAENVGSPPVLSFDETGQLPTGERDRARHVVWSVYMGGGNYEMFTQLPAEGYRAFADYFADMTRARTFLETLPFWEMRPANELITEGTGYVLADAGETIAVYLPYGEAVTVNLREMAGDRTATWYHPGTGEFTPGPAVSAEEPTHIFTPPFSGDAALLIERTQN